MFNFSNFEIIIGCILLYLCMFHFIMLPFIKKRFELSEARISVLEYKIKQIMKE